MYVMFSMSCLDLTLKSVRQFKDVLAFFKQTIFLLPVMVVIHVSAHSVET